MISLELTPAEPGTPGTRMKATLKNAGNTPLLVNTRLGVSRPQRGGELFLRVLDGAGQELPFTARVNIGAPDASHFEQLAPGQAVERAFDLGLYFALRDQTGTLQVTGTYANDHAGPAGRTAWQGQVQSAPVSLTLP